MGDLEAWAVTEIELRVPQGEKVLGLVGGRWSERRGRISVLVEVLHGEVVCIYCIYLNPIFIFLYLPFICFFLFKFETQRLCNQSISGIRQTRFRTLSWASTEP
jgi:hypothetical protein